MPRRSRTLAGFIAAERAAVIKRTGLVARRHLRDIASTAMQSHVRDVRYRILR